MRPSRTIISLAILLFPLLALAQDAKQELNDQMWEAVRKGDAPAVKALLDKGADVNAKFRYGATALFKAAERGNLEVVNVLLERGADVKVKDTFYGATAMTWALNNQHLDVVRALLKKSPAEVDDVLLTGARGGNVKLVGVALDQGGSKPETLTVALSVALTSEKKNPEIAALLKQAGAVQPPELDAATLQAYSGKYKNEQARELVLNTRDGQLFAAAPGQPPTVLIVVDKVTLRPRDFDGFNIVMNLDREKVTGLSLKQGTTSTLYKKVEESKQP